MHRGDKTPREKIRAALEGRVTDHHRFLLRLHLCQIEALDAAIAKIDEEVDGGKRRSNRLRKGARWLKTLLIQCAWEAVRKKGF